MLALERALPHDVEALENSAFLLTIAWPEDTLEFDRAVRGGNIISFDPAHEAVHYPPDRRYRIWIRPSILIGIGIAILSVIAVSWIEVTVSGLPHVPAVSQISVSTLRSWRLRRSKTGPPFTRLGRMVMYSMTQLEVHMRVGQVTRRCRFRPLPCRVFLNGAGLNSADTFGLHQFDDPEY
jgi:hypothetical protein